MPVRMVSKKSVDGEITLSFDPVQWASDAEFQALDAEQRGMLLSLILGCHHTWNQELGKNELHESAHRIVYMPPSRYAEKLPLVLRHFKVSGKQIEVYGYDPADGWTDRRFKERIPSDIRWQVWERDNFTCKTCGSRKNLSIDHIIAESRGGKLEMENLQTLCKSCNSSKGSR